MGEGERPPVPGLKPATTRCGGLSRRRCSPIGYGLLALGWSATALSDFDFKSYAASQLEYNSNVYETADSDEAFDRNDDRRQSDRLLHYIAGLEADYRAGLQRLHASAEGRRVDHEHFNELDRNEHKLAGRFDWQLSSVVGGSAELQTERRLAALGDLDTSELTHQRDETARADVTLQITPSWRMEAGLRGYRSTLPLPGYPDFRLGDNHATLRLRERTTSVAVKYLGTAAVTAGVLGKYTNGEFTGVPDAHDFDEYSLEGTADYVVSGISTLKAALGGVVREQDPKFGGGDERINSVIGSVGYVRTISAKTTTKAELFRRISNYIAGANAIIDTGLAASATWQATNRLGVEGRLGYTHSKFQADTPGGGDEAGRKDRIATAALELNYRLRDWLLLRPFTEYRDRDSNEEDDSYTVTIAGLEVRATFD